MGFGIGYRGEVANTAVCKTAIHGFKSHRYLHTIFAMSTTDPQRSETPMVIGTNAIGTSRIFFEKRKGIFTHQKTYTCHLGSKAHTPLLK